MVWPASCVIYWTLTPPTSDFNFPLLCNDYFNTCIHCCGIMNIHNLLLQSPFVNMSASYHYCLFSSILQFHSVVVHLLLNEMVLYCYVLRSTVKLWILCHTDCRLIVFEDYSCSCWIMLQISGISCHSHNASCAALARAIYSASAV